MRFSFKLEPVLKVRGHEENVEKQKLAFLLREENELRQKYNRKRKRLTEIWEAKNDKEIEGHHRERMMQNFLMEEERSLGRIKETLKEKKKGIETQKNRVIEANKQVRMIQKIKQKALMQHLKEAEHQDQLVQNEVATQMYLRQHTDGL